MQRIRRALINQSLPPECKSTSCPIYRGDDRHYILDRMDGSNGFRATGTHDPHRAVRERVSGSRIKVNGPHDKKVEIGIEFHIEGTPIIADLFVALQLPNDEFIFLPNYADYPLPMACEIELRHEESQQISISVQEDRLEAVGTYKICAALFECKSNPNLLSNCYWSAVIDFRPNETSLNAGQL